MSQKIIVNGRNEFLLQIKNIIIPNPTCVELGVLRGEFSEHIINVLTPNKLYLVDPWEENSDKNGESEKYGSQLDYLSTAYSSEDHRQGVLKKFSSHISKGVVEVIKSFSYDIVSNFPDNYFDFIYLDACHLYGCVKEDLKTYYPKLKNNGLICGHDYVNFDNFGVVRAVDEFITENNLEFIVYNSYGYDWALRKKT